MKKALVIANMIFASATVWGMVPNDGRCDHQTGNHFNMKNLKEEIENIKEISPAKKSESLLCLKLFELAQSGMKDNNWLPKEMKLLLSKLKSEDILKYAEQNFWSSFSKKNSYEIEESAKKKVKTFFHRVLIGKKSGGNAKDRELREDLFAIAVETIDSAICVRDPYAANSYANKLPSNIECFYREEVDLIHSLIHETAHILDDFYRLRKKFGKSKAVNILKNKDELKQILEQGEIISTENISAEYVSIFFDLLSEMCSSINEFTKGYSYKYRIWDLLKKLLSEGLKHELVISYDENRELYDAFLHGYKRDEIISKLKENPKIQLYIDEKWEGTLAGWRAFKDRQDVWTNLLQKLGEENDKYCAELRDWLCNLEIGKCSLIGFRKEGNVFTFKKDGKIIEKSFPKLIDDKIENNWGKFCDYVKGKKDLSWKDSLKNSNNIVKDTVQRLHHMMDKYENNIVDYGFGSLNNEKVFVLKICKSLENADKTQTIGCSLPQLNKNDLEKIKKSVDDRFDNIMMQRYFEYALKKWNRDDLIQLFRDTSERRSELIDYKPSEDIITNFIFKKDGQQIEIPLPLGFGFDWEKIYELTKKRSCFSSITPIIDSVVNFVTGRIACFEIDEHIRGTFNAFKMFEKHDFEQILNNGGPLITEKLMDELIEPEPLTWPKKFIKEFCDHLKANKNLPSKWIYSIENLLHHARSHSLEDMNEDEIEYLKYLEHFKPIGITEKSAEKLLEFLRRQ